MSLDSPTQYSHEQTLKLIESVGASALKRPFYQRHWQESNLRLALNKLQKEQIFDFPLMTKDDLKNHWSEIMVLKGAVDICSSSGTTGRPVDIPITFADEQSRILRVRRMLREMGVQADDRVLCLFSLNDLFTFGPLAWQGVKAEGACGIRCSPNRLERILMVLEHLQPQFVIGNPYSLVRLAESAGSSWPAVNRLPGKALYGVEATFTSDLQPTPVAREMASLWGLEDYFNQYGCSELGPVAFECREHRGCHIHDDFFYIELVDPQTYLPVSAGKPGVIVATTLQAELGFLPVRYLTGDVAAWMDTTPCPCGRKSPRLGPIVGRMNQLLKVQGQSVLPDFLIEAAQFFAEVSRSAVLVEDGPLGEDLVTLLILVEPKIADLTKSKVLEKLSASLAVTPGVKVVTAAELNTLEESVATGNLVKIPRFFDQRRKK